MIRWTMIVLAVVMFACGILSHVRTNAIAASYRAQNSGNGGNEQKDALAPAVVDSGPDMPMLLSEAFVRGEVWFCFPPVVWSVMGVGLSVGAVALTVLARWRRKRTPEG